MLGTFRSYTHRRTLCNCPLTCIRRPSENGGHLMARSPSALTSYDTSVHTDDALSGFDTTKKGGASPCRIWSLCIYVVSLWGSGMTMLSKNETRNWYHNNPICKEKKTRYKYIRIMWNNFMLAWLTWSLLHYSPIMLFSQYLNCVWYMCVFSLTIINVCIFPQYDTCVSSPYYTCVYFLFVCYLWAFFTKSLMEYILS